MIFARINMLLCGLATVLIGFAALVLVGMLA